MLSTSLRRQVKNDEHAGSVSVTDEGRVRSGCFVVAEIRIPDSSEAYATLSHRHTHRRTLATFPLNEEAAALPSSGGAGGGHDAGV